MGQGSVKHMPNKKIVQKHIADAHYSAFSNLLDNDDSFDAIALDLLKRTGMRQEELVVMTKDSFDLVRCAVHIMACKDSVSRWAELPRHMLPRLKRISLALGDRTVGELLCRSRDIMSQKRIVRRLFDRYMRKANGLKFNPYSTHALRYSYAHKAWKSKVVNGNIMKLQLLMGHKSINSTARYIQCFEAEDMQAEIAKVMDTY